jgi:hypothetical protein
MRLADYVTLNFNSNTSTAAVFLDIEKAFVTTWHSGLLLKLSKLALSTSLITLVASVLTTRLFDVLVEGEFSSPREIVAGVPQGSVLAPILYSLYINDAPTAPETHFALFADDTRIHATEKHERRVPCKLPRGLTAVKPWCERWNIKINEGKIQAIYFSRIRRVPGDVRVLHLKGRDVPFVNNVAYLGVTFDRRMTWKNHIERTVAKSLRSYLFKSERLSTNIKLTLYKALIRSVITYACPI